LHHGGGGSLAAVAFSKVGDRVVTAGSDFRVCVWDTATGALVGPARSQHPGPVEAVDLSPDGNIVATGSKDGSLRLWRLSVARNCSGSRRHTGRVTCVVFSPDRKLLLTGSVDQTARLWDGRTGRAVGGPWRHDSSVLAGAFSLDGKFLLTGFGEGRRRGGACLWQVSTGERVGPVLEHPAEVTSLGFAPDGKTLAIGGGQTVPPVVRGNLQARRSAMAHSGSVLNCAFSPMVACC